MDILTFNMIVWLIIGMSVLSTIVWVIALVDILRSEFRGQNDKAVWVLVVALTGIIGAIIYFIVGKKQKLY